jgi:hypothetical protein
MLNEEEKLYLPLKEQSGQEPIRVSVDQRFTLRSEVTLIVLIVCVVSISGAKVFSLLSSPKDQIEHHLTVSKYSCEVSCQSCPGSERKHIIDSVEYLFLWPILYTPTNISCRFLSKATTYSSGCVGVIGSECFGNCLTNCGIENFSWSSWIWSIHSIT